MGLGQLQVAAGEDDVGAVDAATLKRQAWYASLVWKGGPALDQNPRSASNGWYNSENR